MSLIRRLRSLLAPELAYAHCDIPCGIYKREPSQTAAETVHKMVTKILELKPPGANASQADQQAYSNTLGRMVTVKEHHAQLCKNEVLILWTDYFKPENAPANLHEAVWKATKLCSKNKQNVDLKAAEDLLAAVRQVGDLFDAAEKAKAKK